MRSTVRLVLDGHALAHLVHLVVTIADVREHADEHGVVEHRGVEQLLLLGVGELIVAAHPPFIVTEEPLEGLVVSGEDGLRTGAVERLGVVEVVDEPHVVRKRSREVLRVLQFLIDASTEPRGLAVGIHCLVFVHAGSHQSREGQRNAENEFFHTY